VVSWGGGGGGHGHHPCSGNGSSTLARQCVCFQNLTQKPKIRHNTVKARVCVCVGGGGANRGSAGAGSPDSAAPPAATAANDVM